MNKDLSNLQTIFCILLVASNIFETKIFSVGPLVLTGGFLIFPITYILNDLISEVYGYRCARRTILFAFAANALFVLMAQAVSLLPAAGFWDGQEHFDYIFKANLRITAASMAAFVTGSLMNALVMTKMKKLQGGKGFGWRAIASTLAGEGIDSLVFFPIAFWSVGAGNLLKMMVVQVLLKTAYEVVMLPLTSSIVKQMKKKTDYKWE